MKLTTLKNHNMRRILKTSHKLFILYFLFSMDFIHADMMCTNVIESLNKKLLPILEDITQTKDFSAIKINISNKCQNKDIMQQCKTPDCKLPSVLDNDQGFEINEITSWGNKVNGTCVQDNNSNDSIVNLYIANQDFTNFKTGASNIWEQIYDIADANSKLRHLISGIHFSVAVHSAKNFKKNDNGYLSDFGIYEQKYTPNRRRNLHFLLLFLKRALKNVSMEMFDCVNLDDKTRAYIQKLLLVNKEDKIKDICMPPMDIKKEFDKMDSLLDCIECGTCKLWGKIQFYGLRTALYLIDNQLDKIKSIDLMYLIQLMNKISESINISNRYEESLKNGPRTYECDFKDFECPNQTSENVEIVKKNP
ncbi:hypothetical protein EDEG_01618 [Edhazardia aedis USNM 41457]|uniref:Endoplasmic oxidoreductin-1 n=1 Tax=Edhazardia aedis (strain USNM 41457) TaxID=1003232 RepID=J9D8M7_EDHAE|nr:hypothetical protein EDEG_01618 [Edhazardia aedis USNM 41457]|eukprot:EJW04096.1 hypothetical protein EDEG_01618 [Edhazardia aedis USNM 41457]